MSPIPAKLRGTTSGNKKGRTNVRPFRRSGGTDYFLNGRLSSSHFFSGAFGASFFSGALVVVPVVVGLVHGGFTVGVVVGVVGVVGGTPPPPAAAPKRETEAKRSTAARSGVFMTKVHYARIRGLKTLIIYHLSKVSISACGPTLRTGGKGGSCVRFKMSNNTHTTLKVARHETQQA